MPLAILKILMMPVTCEKLAYIFLFYYFLNILTYLLNILSDIQRRAHKEALEQSSSAADIGDAATSAAVQGDEDLVVDNLAGDVAADDQPQQQQQILYSLDQAILHSIERCCKSTQNSSFTSVFCQK